MTLSTYTNDASTMFLAHPSHVTRGRADDLCHICQMYGPVRVRWNAANVHKVAEHIAAHRARYTHEGHRTFWAQAAAPGTGGSYYCEDCKVYFGSTVRIQTPEATR